jgi:hypothetical protein
MEHDNRRPGFTIGDNASRAGKLGHEMGLTRQWTAEEAQYYGRLSGGRPRKLETIKLAQAATAGAR